MRQAHTQVFAGRTTKGQAGSLGFNPSLYQPHASIHQVEAWVHKVRFLNSVNVNHTLRMTHSYAFNCMI